MDTSIWIDHFNKADKELIKLLNSDQVCIHTFVIGELACGNFANRSEILALLNALPRIEPALDEEIFNFIEVNRLYGIGLGYIDIHLIASALINNVKIWTRDKSLQKAVTTLNISK